MTHIKGRIERIASIRNAAMVGGTAMAAQVPEILFFPRKPSGSNSGRMTRWRRLRRELNSVLMLCVLFTPALIAGCASFGPPTIARDRFDYVASISDSWKRQMLHNLVKIRYSDAPVFLDVTSVINSYAWEGELNMGGQIARFDQGDTFVQIGGSGRYADRPTITYSPLIGEKFARNFMSPLPINSLLHLIQSGFPADVMFRVAVSTINGLENEYGGPGNSHPGNPRFAEILIAMREAQSAGTLGVRRKSSKEGEAAIMFLPESEKMQSTTKKIQELLNLNPQEREYRVVHGRFPADNNEVAILTRSMLQIFVDFASYIEVPPADLAEGRVYSPARTVEQIRIFPPILRVRNDKVLPSDAYVAIRYRNRWFWIDDRDVMSKNALILLMLMFSLTETGAPQSGAPVVTIPTR